MLIRSLCPPALALLVVACATPVAPSKPAAPAPTPTPATPSGQACGPSTDPAERQVELWMSQLTRDEKIALVAGTGFDTVGMARLGISSLRMTDGPLGVREGHSTAFPAGSLLAASFDPSLVERVGVAIAREVKGHGRNVILGPGVNIVRTALNGRNFEYFGEDPELAARLGVAYVRGVQSQGVLATVKHFAANNQEAERETINAEVDLRALHEVYLPAFEATIKEGGALGVMCAYNRVNGSYACEHPGLLGKVLKQSWGFRGLVMSDWTATHSTAASIRAGLDLEMPKPVHFTPATIRDALAAKQIEPSHLDDMVRRQLYVIAALHLDQDPTPQPEAIDTFEHRALAREAARSGLVLLKNDGALPLNPAKLRRVAVVGPRGDKVDGGGGSAHVSPAHKVTLVEALRETLGSKVRVDYAPGEVTLDGLEPIPAAVLTPPPGHAGPGLLGEYFLGTAHAGAPKLVRVDSAVDFRWELAAPAPGLPEDGFSVRWTGKLTPKQSGRYALGLRSDDGSRLSIDGKLVVDNWGDHAPTLKTAELDLVAGKSYDVRVEYYEGIIGASCQLLWQPVEKDPLRRVAEIAKGADVVIAAVGDGMNDETEGTDRRGLSLPGRQDEIVRIAAAANPRVVVIATTGAAMAMPWLNQVKAVLHAWFPGQEAGLALTDVLLGQVSPSGKLPISFPRRIEDEPAFGNYPGKEGKVAYGEGVLVGYRWYDTRKIAPLFPFGFGLSYTTFAYSDLTVSPWDEHRGVQVSFKVKNVGQRPGAEVAQIYVHDDEASLPRPEQELRGFARVHLAPGEERQITISLPPRAFAYFDPTRPSESRWRVEPGTFEVRAASSSRDVRLKARVSVPGK